MITLRLAHICSRASNKCFLTEKTSSSGWYSKIPGNKLYKSILFFFLDFCDSFRKELNIKMIDKFTRFALF